MAVTHGLLEISHAVRRRSDSRNDYIGRYNIIGTYNYSDNNIIIVSPVPQHHRRVGGGEKFTALLPDDDGSRRKYI